MLVNQREKTGYHKVKTIRQTAAILTTTMEDRKERENIF